MSQQYGVIAALCLQMEEFTQNSPELLSAKYEKVLLPGGKGAKDMKKNGKHKKHKFFLN